MKSYLVFVCLWCVMALSGWASMTDGATLMAQWREYKKANSGVNAAVVEAGSFSGYVRAVADCYDGKQFDIPDGITLGSLCMSVGKYLETTPRIKTKPAHELVIAALKKAYPP